MKEITPDETAHLLNEENIVIIDVRENEEVAMGKIPGSINIPLGELQNRLKPLDKTKKYIIVCRSGNRSSYATNVLHSLGYDAANMVGGMLEWRGPVNKRGD